jgi:hypothetical protein
MAQQKSILKFQGTISKITFYKSQDGYLPREKGGRPSSLSVMFLNPKLGKSIASTKKSIALTKLSGAIICSEQHIFN